MIPLPRTAHCVVCGPANPHGLHLTSSVDPATGRVHTPFTPQPHHVGFDGLVHGGVLSTVADEAMVWAAIWSARRSCVAGELSVRFRRPAAPDQPLMVIAQVVRARHRMIETSAALATAAGDVVATATGKYLAGTEQETAAFFATLLPGAEPAIAHLRGTEAAAI